MAEYYTYDKQCEKCDFWKTSQVTDRNNNLRLRSGIFGRGTGENGILLIGDSLTAESVVNGANFQGSGGNLLTNILIKSGIDPQKCFWTTLFKCYLPGNKKPKIADIKLCQDNTSLLDLPKKDWEPKLLVLLGNQVLQYFSQSQKLKDRRGQFTRLPFLGKEYPAIITYHPNIVFYNPKEVNTLELDFRRISEYIRGIRFDQLPQHNRNYCDSFDKFSELLQLFSSFPKEQVFSVDIETTGLELYQNEQEAKESSYKNTIVSISITTKIPDKEEYISFCFLTKYRQQDDEYWFLPLENRESKEYTLLKDFLENHNILCHNGDFDIRFFWQYGINAKYEHDTIDAHLLLEEDEPHKLKYLVKKFIAAGAGYEQKIQDVVEDDPSQYGNTAKEILLEYNMDDSFFTYLLHEIFNKELKKQNLYDFYINHAMPLRKVMTRISHRGVLVDKFKLLNLADSYRNKIIQGKQLLFQIVGKEFNDSSSQQIADVLYNDLQLPILNRTEKGAPSTDKKTLSELAKKSPIAKLLIDLRHYKKMCTTYLDGKLGDKDDEKRGDGSLKYLDKNNRMHSNYFTSGTNSGRLSCRSQNFQNISKDSDIRNIFIAPDGWKLIEIDYKTAELVMLAYLSGDKKFIKAVNERDLHEDVARLLLKVDENKKVDDEIRTIAKRINFRKAYRGGPKGLAEQLGITLNEAYNWFKRWDESFPDVLNWFSFQDNLWRKQNYIESIYGRKKRFADCNYLLGISRDDYNARMAFYDRIAVNFPCQSAVADTTNRAIYLFEKALDEIFGPWKPDNSIYLRPGVILTVHDSIIVECPDELVDDILDLLITCATIPLPKLGISLKVDVKISQVWMQKEEEIEEERVYQEV